MHRARQLVDDVMSLLPFSLAVAGAEVLFTGNESLTLIQMLELPLFEIGGSILVGFLAGTILKAIMERMKSFHDSMAVGTSETFGLSLILSSMVMGIMVVNLAPEHGKRTRFTIEQAGPVIYVLFFNLAGAPG